MTKRYHSLTVVLEHDIRDDDCQSLINAICMLRGVQSVNGEVADRVTHMAEQRAKQELRDRLWAMANGTLDNLYRMEMGNG